MVAAKAEAKSPAKFSDDAQFFIVNGKKDETEADLVTRVNDELAKQKAQDRIETLDVVKDSASGALSAEVNLRAKQRQ